MTFTNYLEAALLNHVFGAEVYTAPSSLYIGLCTGVAEDGTITGEPTTGCNYARVEITNNTTNWPHVSVGSKVNGTAITFAEACGSWGTTFTTFFVADAATSGNVLAYGSLSAAKTIGSGDQPKFNTSGLTITLD